MKIGKNITPNNEKKSNDGQCVSNSMNSYMMMTTNLHVKLDEALCYNALDLCKRLMHKEDLLKLAVEGGGNQFKGASDENEN